GLGWRRLRRRALLQPSRRSARANPSARDMREHHVRRSQEEPAVHGRYPFAVQRLRQHPRNPIPLANSASTGLLGLAWRRRRWRAKADRPTPGVRTPGRPPRTACGSIRLVVTSFDPRTGEAVEDVGPETSAGDVAHLCATALSATAELEAVGRGRR